MELARVCVWSPISLQLYLHDRKVVPVYRDEWGDTVPVENVAMDLRDKAGYRSESRVNKDQRQQVVIFRHDSAGAS